MPEQRKNQGGKGNPASHRMSNPRLKAARAKSWARGQARKAAARVLVATAERENSAARAAGGLTPWEQAQAKRRQRRGGAA